MVISWGECYPKQIADADFDCRLIGAAAAAKALPGDQRSCGFGAA
jgi:hypothetical protein